MPRTHEGIAISAKGLALVSPLGLVLLLSDASRVSESQGRAAVERLRIHLM